VHFGVSSHRHIEVGNLLEAVHQVGGVRVAIGMRLVELGAFWHVTAQCDQMPDTHVPILPGDIIDLPPARANAGQMGRRGQVCFFKNPGNRGMRSFARRTIGTIGYGNEARL